MANGLAETAPAAPSAAPASRATDWNAALEGVPAAAPLRQALLGTDRKAIETAAAQVAKAAGRNTVAGTLASEIRGRWWRQVPQW